MLFRFVKPVHYKQNNFDSNRVSQIPIITIEKRIIDFFTFNPDFRDNELAHK